MEAPEITFIPKLGQFDSGETAVIGSKKYKVGSFSWDATRTKGSDVPPYAVFLNLPGLKTQISNVDSIENAILAITKGVKIWFSNL